MSMKAVIFTEDSDTTSDDTDNSLLEYYKGTFLSAKSVYDELSEICDTELYVVSDDFGVADASRNAEKVIDDTAQYDEELPTTAKTNILEKSAEADVMVVMFSSDVFESAVVEGWRKIADEAKPRSVWCLCAPRSLLGEIDTSLLTKKDCTVVTYERVGVARIGTETREQLISVVRGKLE